MGTGPLSEQSISRPKTATQVQAPVCRPRSTHRHPSTRSHTRQVRGYRTRVSLPQPHHRGPRLRGVEPPHGGRPSPPRTRRSLAALPRTRNVNQRFKSLRCAGGVGRAPSRKAAFAPRGREGAGGEMFAGPGGPRPDVRGRHVHRGRPAWAAPQAGHRTLIGDLIESRGHVSFFSFLSSCMHGGMHSHFFPEAHK